MNNQKFNIGDRVREIATGDEGVVVECPTCYKGSFIEKLLWVDWSPNPDFIARINPELIELVKAKENTVPVIAQPEYRTLAKAWGEGKTLQFFDEHEWMDWCGNYLNFELWNNWRVKPDVTTVEKWVIVWLDVLGDVALSEYDTEQEANVAFKSYEERDRDNNRQGYNQKPFKVTFNLVKNLE